MLNPENRLLPHWLAMSDPCARVNTIRGSMAIIAATDAIAEDLTPHLLPADLEALRSARIAINEACQAFLCLAEAADHA